MVFLEKSRWVTALIFCVTVIAIVVISSAGLHTANLPVLPNQLATATIDAAMPFSYESAHRTQQAREQILDRVPPVYALETKSLLKFEAAMRELLQRNGITVTPNPPPATPAPATPAPAKK